MKTAFNFPAAVVMIVLAASVGGALGAAAFPPQTVTVTRTEPEVCGADSSAHLRTTLYFGTNRPKGTVSELDWQIFVRDEVTTRFPDGLTVWDAHGQWKGGNGAVEQERSKVLLIVHADSDKARAAIQDVIGRYRKLFEQQAVLWETARVCVSM